MIRPSGVGVGKPPVNGVKSWPRSEEPPRGDWLLLLSRLPDERGEDAVADFGVATEYCRASKIVTGGSTKVARTGVAS